MDRRPLPPPAVAVDISSPSPSPRRPKKRQQLKPGGSGGPPPTLVVIDDDLTPQKADATRTPSFVAETPFSPGFAFDSDPSVVKCSLSRANFGNASSDKFAATSSFVQIVGASPLHGCCMAKEALLQTGNHSDDQDCMFDKEDFTGDQNCKGVIVDGRKNHKTEADERKKKLKEEKRHLLEERKRQKQQEKLKKEALKSEAAEAKKLEKERQKWEKGKFALKSILAEIDVKVIENGSVGGHLLTRFAEKGLSFRVTSNPVERSIMWKMNVPDHIAKVSEQNQYKNPSNASCWKCPPVEEILSKLTTHYSNVHSRQCIDEAELAEHVVGLTCSLANCQFRSRLETCLHWNQARAGYSLFIRLKALIAIPKVQPRHAVAIWKKYPTMRSLLNVYMDPNKSVHEKEFLLKDLMVTGIVGTEDRRLGEICSKRVYRVLMAQTGGIKTDDVEEGADFFHC
ncbi:ERCC4 domain [Musa troglodytarum]|uniref:ERCC4 domain n=1 Tax=Musa troglodytarum TaxID=320322 RepID=A0A9E7K9V6_9LILI|nr:ERCC4 domain [Musa troglodytarum]